MIYYIPAPYPYIIASQYAQPIKQEVISIPPQQTQSYLPIQPPSLSIDLPKFKYEKQKIVPIPFDSRKSNGKFDNISDAIKFIMKHTLHFHGQVNRNLIYTYLPFCRVFNPQIGDYMSASMIQDQIQQLI